MRPTLVGSAILKSKVLNLTGSLMHLCRRGRCAGEHVVVGDNALAHERDVVCSVRTPSVQVRRVVLRRIDHLNAGDRLPLLHRLKLVRDRFCRRLSKCTPGVSPRL